MVELYVTKIGKGDWISINCNYDEVRSIIRIILKVTIFIIRLTYHFWTDDHVSFIYKCVHSVHSALNDER